MKTIKSTSSVKGGGPIPTDRVKTKPMKTIEATNSMKGGVIFHG